MKKIKEWLQVPKNKIITGVVAVLIIGGGGFGVWSITQSKKVIVPPLQIKEPLEFEYGQSNEKKMYGLKKIELSDIVSNLEVYDTVDFKSLNPTTKTLNDDFIIIDTSTVGEHTSTITVSYKGEYHQTSFPYKVVDTHNPEFNTVMNIDTPYNTEPEYKDIIKATDIVDGELEVSISGEIDVTVAGIYDMEASATDKNGNTSKHAFKVTVQEEVKEAVVEPTTPSNNNTSSGGSSSSNNSSSGDSSQSGGGGGTTETPKPVEPPVTPSRPDPYQVAKEIGMIFYKDYGNTDGCLAVMNSELDNHYREWKTNLCDDNGYMFYTPR